MDALALERFYLFVRKECGPEQYWVSTPLDGRQIVGPYPAWPPGQLLYIDVWCGVDCVKGEEIIVSGGELRDEMRIEHGKDGLALRSRGFVKGGEVVWRRTYGADIIDLTYRLPGNRLFLFRDVLWPARGQFPHNRPFQRGPAHSMAGSTGHEYFCECDGDFSSFHTTERIIHRPTGRELYRYTDDGGLSSLEPFVIP